MGGLVYQKLLYRSAQVASYPERVLSWGFSRVIVIFAVVHCQNVGSVFKVHLSTG